MELGQWKCVRPATISASWLQVQLLVTNVPRNPLVSANGNSYGILISKLSCRGDMGNYYTQARFLAMGNGDGERNMLPGAGDATDSSCNYVVSVASAMENAEGSQTPAARDVVTGPCLLSSDAGEGWQWSQWREPLFPKRCRVSFEGRSWP